AIDAGFVDHRWNSLILLLDDVWDRYVATIGASVKGLPTHGWHHTSRDCTTAASTKDANNGCGSKGRDFSSGWNCTPMNHGWSSYSTISGKIPSGDSPEKRRPCCSSL